MFIQGQDYTQFKRKQIFQKIITNSNYGCIYKQDYQYTPICYQKIQSKFIYKLIMQYNKCTFFRKVENLQKKCTKHRLIGSQ
ncbi:unnamed protein product [Paramecium primaurelia]|uniref:Uncharacterized protein n=1 Tax=Paramecium primaurelia TaxID=5886 RepID=A0A8S1Q451_PARPR|nr:unnamed protein product [Paramecium primaurelia]